VGLMHVVQLLSFLNKVTIIQVSYNAKNIFTSGVTIGSSM